MPSLSSQNPHLTDPLLQPFLSATFDPTSYLNATLPTLSITTSPPPKPPSQSKPTLSLNDHTAQTQTHLSQLSAQTSRLTTLLTQQTDDILRSGSRLAYEVEVLRGQTLSLTEALNDNLKEDVSRFVPDEVGNKEASKAEDTTTAAPTTQTPQNLHSITHLRTLTLVRTRLNTVLKIFDQALSWPLPPPTETAFISVSAPNSSTTQQEAQTTAQKFRDEINELFVSDGVGGIEGVEAASRRVGELRVLCEVWKGTGEEKSRGRFVGGLERMVEERRRAVLEGSGGKKGGKRREGSPNKGVGAVQVRREGRAGSETGGYGFIDNLQRLRGNIYLE
ncbi:MAG: hypothetical protein M1812_006283 [Candelaria pacifica]|nr:MAG: hypothetical protein M1812_006283 [Candelaria pacifica]